MRRAVRSVVKDVVDPVLFRLDPQYPFHRAQRDWNQRAKSVPKETTATFDARDWQQYWASGYRDRDLLLEVARQAGPCGTELAVEIGCGLGRVTRPLAELFREVLGVDIAGEMLKQATQHASAANVRYELVGADQHLPLPDSTADLIVAWTVFRHVSKSVFAGYLKEACRVLKPGACLVFESQIRERGVGREPAPYDSLTEREYSRAELATYCQVHGYAWAAEQTTSSVTPGTSTLTVAWARDRS